MTSLGWLGLDEGAHHKGQKLMQATWPSHYHIRSIVNVPHDEITSSRMQGGHFIVILSFGINYVKLKKTKP